TGTGNSLYVAEKLAEKLGESEIYSMAKYTPKEQIGGKDERIGFVFPSYYGNLPRIVHKFVGTLDIAPDAYIFGIVTMGAMGTGSITMLEKALAEKKLTLEYGCGIYMPANYIANYNPMFLGRTAKSGKKIQKIAGDILAKKTMIKKNRVIADNLYKNIEELDKEFFAESQCNGCGQCEQICPVENIRIASARPEWLHRCEHCMACIHRCPQKAIQYGAKTKKRRRYYCTGV
ncbi:MAG: EFR1 family ferrodoxin, partial [Oscillospiraceae bacterium]|nr:EFR1 family ferrodoxin [Oscillospiraceae bacterium]